MNLFLADVNVHMDLNQVIDNLGKGLQKYGPGAWTTVQQVRHWEALGWVLMGTQFLIIAIIALCLSFRWYKDSHRTDKNGDREASGVYTFGGSLALAVAIITGGIASAHLLNIWTWVGVFNPGLSIAHDILQKALNG